MSLAAHAQRRGNRHAGSFEQQIQDKIVEVSQIMARLERALPNMRSGAQRQTNAKLDEVLAILKSQGPVRPGPRPTPGPHPRGTLITGSIENVPFTFEAVDATDLAVQCFQTINVGNVDDIKISVDFSPMEHLYNSHSYWKGKGQVCAKIASKAIELGLPHHNSSGYLLMGSIENTSFMFEGYSLREILNQCTDLHANARLGNVDDIHISVNGAPIQHLYNSHSYWRNSGEVCNEIIQLVR